MTFVLFQLMNLLTLKNFVYFSDGRIFFEKQKKTFNGNDIESRESHCLVISKMSG